MQIDEVAVIGAGTMGSGIAQVFLQSGFSVVMVDCSPRALEQGRNRVENGLNKFVAKGKLSETQAKDAIGRLTISTSLEAVKNAGFVIEAVFEDKKVKGEVLREVGRFCLSDVIVATNTSSISITELGNFLGEPQRFLGVHFMNPVPLMPLVEVISGELTAPEVLSFAVELCRKLGKTPLQCQDYPGFVSNRILMPMINEAVYALMEGVAEKEAIDGIMKLGMNHPMGPLELADLIGLDVCLAIMEVLHQGLGDKYRPCPLLRRMVAAGKLGRKSGIGFYSYK